jgi:hypothetical protein
MWQSTAACRETLRYAATIAEPLPCNRSPLRGERNSGTCCPVVQASMRLHLSHALTSQRCCSLPHRSHAVICRAQQTDTSRLAGKSERSRARRRRQGPQQPPQPAELQQERRDDAQNMPSMWLEAVEEEEAELDSMRAAEAPGDASEQEPRASTGAAAPMFETAPSDGAAARAAAAVERESELGGGAGAALPEDAMSPQDQRRWESFMREVNPYDFPVRTVRRSQLHSSNYVSICTQHSRSTPHMLCSTSGLRHGTPCNSCDCVPHRWTRWARPRLLTPRSSRTTTAMKMRRRVQWCRWRSSQTGCLERQPPQPEPLLLRNHAQRRGRLRFRTRLLMRCHSSERQQLHSSSHLLAWPPTSQQLTICRIQARQPTLMHRSFPRPSSHLKISWMPPVQLSTAVLIPRCQSFETWGSG